MWSNQKDKLLKVSPAAIVHDRPNIVWPSSICIWFPCKQHSESLDSCYSLPMLFTSHHFSLILSCFYPPLSRMILWYFSPRKAIPKRSSQIMDKLLINPCTYSHDSHTLCIAHIYLKLNSKTSCTEPCQLVTPKKCPKTSSLWSKRVQNLLPTLTVQAPNQKHKPPSLQYPSFQASSQIGLPCLI